MKILVVDDDLISQKIMKAICMRLGYKVVTATDGAEALEMFKRYPIRIVISDWVMPRMDGLALCQKIRKVTEKGQVFFFLVTGKRTALGDYNRAREAGVDDFLYKPVDIHVFRNQLAVAEQFLGLVTGETI